LAVRHQKALLFRRFLDAARCAQYNRKTLGIAIGIEFDADRETAALMPAAT